MATQRTDSGQLLERRGVTCREDPPIIYPQPSALEGRKAGDFPGFLGCVTRTAIMTTRRSTRQAEILGLTLGQELERWSGRGGAYASA